MRSSEKNSAGKQIVDERVIDYLRSAIFDGKCGLSDVPQLIKRVIKEDLWQKRMVPQTREMVTFRRFEEFLTTSPPEGLGTDHKTIKKLCDEDLETLELLEEVKTKRFHGGDRRSNEFKTDNISFEKSKYGTSAEYSLKRLRRLRPDLHQQVLEGKLSVNQAMIEAAFRKPKFQITIDLEKMIEFIRKHFDRTEIDYLIENLNN